MRITHLISASLLATPLVLSAQNSVEVIPAQSNATVGDTVRFRAVVKDARGTVIDTARVVWNAAPFDVAWAMPDGRVLPVRQGEVQVLAIYGDQVGRAALTVGPKPPARLELDAP